MTNCLEDNPLKLLCATYFSASDFKNYCVPQDILCERNHRTQRTPSVLWHFLSLGASNYRPVWEYVLVEESVSFMRICKILVSNRTIVSNLLGMICLCNMTNPWQLQLDIQKWYITRPGNFNMWLMLIVACKRCTSSAACGSRRRNGKAE